MDIADGGRTVRGISEQRLVLTMAVVALLLGMVVAATATGGGGDGGIDPPEASFVFERNGTGVDVTHYGGESLDGGEVYVAAGGETVGNFEGSDGQACAVNRSRVTRGDTCTVADVVTETLYVVWQSGGDRYILDRRAGDPTPTPTPSSTPTPSPTPTEGPPDGTPTGTPPDGATPTGTPPDGETPTDGPGTDDGTPTPTPTGTPTPTPAPNGGTSTPAPTPPETGTPAANGTAASG